MSFRYEGKSVEIKVESLVNRITGNDHAKGREVLATEIAEKGIKVEVPKKSFQRKHRVELTLRVDTPNDSAAMDATAEVTDVEDVDDAEELSLTFMQYDQALWERVQAIITAQQERALQLFEAMRGDE